MVQSLLLSLRHSGTAGNLQHFYLLYSCVNAGRCMHTYVHLKQREKLFIGLIIRVLSVPTSKAPAHLTAASRRILLASLSKKLAANEDTGNSRVKAKCSCSGIQSWCQILS